MKQIGLHVHSFSLRYHLRYRHITGYDVFAYIDEMAGLGFTGVNVSANGAGLRDLCGTTTEHLARDEQQLSHVLVSDELRDALAATGESGMFAQPESVSKLKGTNGKLTFN